MSQKFDRRIETIHVTGDTDLHVYFPDDDNKQNFELSFNGRPYEGYYVAISIDKTREMYEALREYFEQQETTSIQE